MDRKLILLRNHVVSYGGKEYTLLPGSVLRVKGWGNQSISDETRALIKKEGILHNPPHDQGTCITCDVCVYDL